MNRVYQNQTKLTLIFEADESLEGVTDMLVKYKKPDKTEGQWIGTITDIDNGVIHYEIETQNDLDQLGLWTVWPYATFADGKSLPGDASKMRVSKEGVAV